MKESVLTDKQKEEIREIIEQQIQEADKELKVLKELTAAVEPDSSIGRISRMDAINNKTVNDAAYRNTRTRLKRLKNVLEKVDDPDYGRCVRCGEPIAFGRIQIMPEKRVCVHCSK
ncbi:TraR/DksA family transcriptional regulator [Natronogracilivirga saccharolytica]|uniref:TraR/DksA C4-type zinc finger protein n=1 Tax=Natronogracilivirga saccharolytica TaxID=2812953 RepID=A0A8J7RKX6_9BACT|nr:TraR/DksA C4-type zinc finger protein [Natronogracilivirga saccharolytica]MBP3193192.1 TraR/DksA C4-type zinc finger protein [Natronogracilivirga saccharolytica]